MVARIRSDSSRSDSILPLLKHGDEVLEGGQIVYDLTNGIGINHGRISRDKTFFTGNYIETHSDSRFDVHKEHTLPVTWILRILIFIARK